MLGVRYYPLRSYQPMAGCIVGLSTSWSSSGSPPTVEPLEPRLLMSGGAPVIGMNLASVSYWDEQWVFVDAMRSSMPWVSQNADPDGSWQNGVPLQADPAGWPVLQSGQAAATLMFRNGGNYPAGQYVVNYEGTGTLSFDFDATVISQSGNRMVLDVTPSAAGIFMRIETSDPNDHVRNVRVTMPGFENATSQFHPLFTQRLQPFGVLRFMDFMRTNNSTLASWNDRTLPNSYTQGGDNGVSVEVMVDLANEMGADPWFNIPIEADDNFVQNFATIVHDRLDPNLKAHIEYSNEVWNGQFTQDDYVAAQGVALGLSSTSWLAGQRYYSQRSVEIFNIFEAVFGGTSRLVRVMGTQRSNLGVSTNVMDWQNAYQSVDALAVAPYFAGGFRGPNRTDQVIQMSVDQILDEIELSLDWDTVGMAQLSDMASAWGVDMVAYEGGQHMVGYWGAENNDTLTQLLIAANRHPRMEQFYHKYLRNWMNDGGKTFVAFNNVCQPSKWGSWGALEYQDQVLDNAPKYKGLLAAASGELFVTGAADTPAAALMAPTLSGTGQNTYSFQVTYSDNVAIDVYDLDSSDIRVVGPNGFNQLAVFDFMDSASFGQSRTANYHVAAPSGSTWTNLHNGTYSVVVESEQVADTLGTPVASGVIGSFSVNVGGAVQGPTANILPITPDPRNSPVGIVTVDFTSDVQNVDVGDFSLTRYGNAIDLSGVSVVALSGSQYILDLSLVTWWSGPYELTLATSDITDLTGNPLSAGSSEAWVNDEMAPTGGIVPITPDPRNNAVGVVTVNFSEHVKNVETSDFTLTHDGSVVSLSGLAVTLVSGSQFALNLSAVTGLSGTYVLTLATSDITDLVGNPLQAGDSDSWVTNTTEPVASIVPITPDLRNDAVGVVTVNFSENVLNVDATDFMLTRDGSAVSLSAVTVAPVSGSQFTLDLSAVTGQSGTYMLTLTTSDITGLTGNPLATGDSDSWVTNMAGPTANIVPITPDPRSDAVSVVSVNFSENVLNVDAGDFTLMHNGSPVNLSGLSVTPVSGLQFALDLSTVTGLSGTYVLTLNTSNITDYLGNPLQAGDIDSWVTHSAGGAGPTISSLVLLEQVSGATVQANPVVLTARGVASAASSVTTVSFYQDTNGDGIGQAAELRGHDTNGSDGWDWLGIGQGGSRYLAQATDGNGAVSEFLTVTALDVTIGDGAHNSLEYTDADGTLVSVKFSGGTAMVSIVGARNLTLQQLNQGVIVTGENLYIDQIDTSATSTKSGLTFKAKGGDDLADVKLISGATAVGRLSARSIDLTGAGIVMTGSGAFGSIQIHDLASGAGVIMPGSVDAVGATIDARRIGDGAAVTLGSAIKSIRFERWVSGQINASWVGSISVTGDRSVGVSGDFGADVTLSGADRENVSVSKLSVAGNLVGGTWAVPGDIKSWKVNANATADITANCLKNASVGGDALGLRMTLTHAVDPLDAKLMALGKFKVKGWFNNSQIRSNGNIGAISVGGSRDSVIHAGVADGVSGTPSTAADFGSLASIKSFKVKGLPGVSASMSRTELAAWSIGQTSLKEVVVNDPAQASTVVANTLNSYSRQEGSTRFRWKSNRDVNVLQQVSAGMVMLVA